MTGNLPSLRDFDEAVMPLVVAGLGSVYSPHGVIGAIQCALDNDAAIMMTKHDKPTLVSLPMFKLSVVPPVIMINRKLPFQRGSEYVRESQHPGVYCEFYENRRGRFMRINDAHRHAVYQLQRAAFTEHPVGFPDPSPDLDLGWFPQRG